MKKFQLIFTEAELMSLKTALEELPKKHWDSFVQTAQGFVYSLQTQINPPVSQEEKKEVTEG